MLRQCCLPGSLLLLAVQPLPAAEGPAWSGQGRYRLQVEVAPVDLGDRDRDQLVARCDLDLPVLLRQAGVSGYVDLSSLQVHGFDSTTGEPIPFPSFDGRSPFDRPCRFEDNALPEAYPDRVGAASDTTDGRPRVLERPRGGRLFNREMDPIAGRLMWVHTQVGDARSHYCIYFNVVSRRELVGPAPAHWLGDVDLYRRAEGAPIGGMSHWNICAADYNGDGLFDLMGGVEKGQLYYFPNHGVPGRPRFVGCRVPMDEEGPIDAGWYCTPFMTDWDDDGLVDVLVGTQHSGILWWKNVGTAAEPKLSHRGFIQADGKRLEVPATPVPEDHAGIFKVDYYNAPTVCDWDGDGLPDILTGGYTTGRIFFYRGTGRGQDGVPKLTLVGPLEADGEVIDTGWSATPTTYDFDGDGKLELITGSWDFQQAHNADRYLMYFVNEGTRAEPRMVRKPFPKRGSFPRNIIARVAVADWNGDRLPDLLVGDHSGDTGIFLNRGSASEPLWEWDGANVTGAWGFVPLSLAQGPEDYIILTYDHMITSIADINGDGKLELMSGDEIHTLSGSPHAPVLVRRGEATVNGERLLNPGPGYGDEYNWNVFSDWDRDGHLDILCGTQQGNVFFHRNTGSPDGMSFEPGGKLKLTGGEDLKVGPAVHDDPKDVKDFTELQGSRIKFIAADIDGDAIDDLVITETFNNIWVFRNTVAGGIDTLEPGVLAVKLPSRTRLSTLDWNNDGKLDLIDGQTPEDTGTIHLNRSEPGHIAFDPPIKPLKLPWVFYGAGFFPMDFNRDGDEDFLIQSEFYLFWAERSFVRHGYAAASLTGGIQTNGTAAGPVTRLKVAAACLNSSLGDTAANLRKLEVACAQAAGRQVTLILFPECWLTGSLSNSKAANAAKAAIQVPGPLVSPRGETVARQIGKEGLLTHELDLTLSPGMTDQADGAENAETQASAGHKRRG